MTGERGQAAVELVAMLPIVVALTLAVAQLLAAGAVRELAGHAAEAGAIARLQGGDPARAARAALPGWARDGLRVKIDGRRVSVEVRPPSPSEALARRLAGRSSMIAGAAS